jgi:AcrR family transcriptional regulator
VPRKGKKEQILEAGRKLFFEKGITATSMEDIAAAVPVSKMTIYNYFQSKEGLLEQVLESVVKEGQEKFRAMVRESANPLEVLYKLAHFRDYDDMSPAFAFDLMKDYKHLADRMLEYQKRNVLSDFEQVIFQGQQQGYIRKDISPHVLVLFLMSMKEFFAHPDQLKDVGDLRALSDQILTILYYGIVHPEHKESLKEKG